MFPIQFSFNCCNSGKFFLWIWVLIIPERWEEKRWKGENTLLSCPNKPPGSLNKQRIHSQHKKTYPLRFPQLVHQSIGGTKMIFTLIANPEKLFVPWKHLQPGFSWLSTLSPASFLLCVGFAPQSCTLFGRMRSGLPSPRGRWTRSGTADTTSGCWRESWCILDSSCPGDDPGVFIFLSAGRSPA